MGHFVQDLRKIVTCKFKQQIEKIIRDRLVFGINDQAVREKLLNVKELRVAK